jgi:hypothetical protein
MLQSGTESVEGVQEKVVCDLCSVCLLHSWRCDECMERVRGAAVLVVAFVERGRLPLLQQRDLWVASALTGTLLRTRLCPVLWADCHV